MNATTSYNALHELLTDNLWSRDDLREDIWEEAHAADVEDE